jgi:hypothetical protein
MREFPRHYCFLDALPRIRYHIRNARVAQWIERLPPEQKAVGSSPSPRTIFPLYRQQSEHRPEPQSSGRGDYFTITSRTIVPADI